jgi:SAM-dependent methyltransferase
VLEPPVLERAAPTDLAEVRYRETRIAHWNNVARKMESRGRSGRSYHRRLAQVIKFFVPPGSRVLEIGCAQGDLLAATEPSTGVGVDFSSEMIELAQRKYPQLKFIEADAHSLDLDTTFDVIILSDLVNDLWDVQRVLEQIKRLCQPHTRIIINFYSRLWEWPLAAAAALGLANPNLAQNWLTVEDVTGLLGLADFEVIRHREEVLLPLPLPPLSTFANRYLVKLWPFRLAALTNVLVARPSWTNPVKRQPGVSVVVAARNEAGNIETIFQRVPELS